MNGKNTADNGGPWIIYHKLKWRQKKQQPSTTTTTVVIPSVIVKPPITILKRESSGSNCGANVRFDENESFEFIKKLCFRLLKDKQLSDDLFNHICIIYEQSIELLNEEFPLIKKNMKFGGVDILIMITKFEMTLKHLISYVSIFQFLLDRNSIRLLIDIRNRYHVSGSSSDSDDVYYDENSNEIENEIIEFLDNHVGVYYSELILDIIKSISNESSNGSNSSNSTLERIDSIDYLFGNDDSNSSDSNDFTYIFKTKYKKQKIAIPSVTTTTKLGNLGIITKNIVEDSIKLSMLGKNGYKQITSMIEYILKSNHDDNKIDAKTILNCYITETTTATTATADDDNLLIKMISNIETKTKTARNKVDSLQKELFDLIVY